MQDFYIEQLQYGTVVGRSAPDPATAECRRKTWNYCTWNHHRRNILNWRTEIGSYVFRVGHGTTTRGKKRLVHVLSASDASAQTVSGPFFPSQPLSQPFSQDLEKSQALSVNNEMVADIMDSTEEMGEDEETQGRFEGGKNTSFWISPIGTIRKCRPRMLLEKFLEVCLEYII
jgi:hypothetical protein